MSERLFLYAWEIDNSLKQINDNLIEVISFANKSNYYFPLLLKSSNYFNYPLKIIGWNTDWRWFGSKLNGYYTYLKSLDPIIYNDRYTLMIDAWDVMFSRNYIDLLNLVNRIDFDIIFSSSVMTKETITSNFDRYFSNYSLSLIFGSKDLSLLINSGVILIKIKTFIDIIENNTVKDTDDDQKYLIKILQNNKLNFFIDHNSKYFLTESYTYITNQINNIKNNIINPYVIHAPGSSILDEFVRLYFDNIFISDEELEQMKPNTLKVRLSRLPYEISYIFNNNAPEIILLIIAITINIFEFLKKFIRR